MDGTIPIGQVASELQKAQRDINQILMALYARVGLVELRTIVRYPEYSKAEHAKMPTVQLFKTIEGATAHDDYK